jgi:lipopolysaccharide transport system ATP-binding protein
MEPVIKVENLGKKYVIHHQVKMGDSAFREVLSQRVKGLLKGRFNKTKSVNEEFWALKNVSFEINKGERVGIIGRNGAGKSTLLKILSQITDPTTGKITIDGKVSSLLEVGTGFHPELTGRENIFLNGAIIGMTRKEIESKFDEIVAFAEIEKFLDTPVKHYSSGMYVRLAFSVSAHINPDILIVDEVLSVGDASFQKKCIGKIEEVSEHGRTIIFVSHNMGQVNNLCTRAILLDRGGVVMQGSTVDVTRMYYQDKETPNLPELYFEERKDTSYYISLVRVLNEKNEVSGHFAHNEKIVLEVTVKSDSKLADVLLGVHVTDGVDKRIFTSEVGISDKFQGDKTKIFRMIIPPVTLTPNTYKFSVGLHIPNIQILDEHKLICPVSVYDNGSEFSRYQDVNYGCVFVKCDWQF